MQLRGQHPRQLYEITGEGRAALVTLRRGGLQEVWFKYDPFDLALTHCGPDERHPRPRKPGEC